MSLISFMGRAIRACFALSTEERFWSKVLKSEDCWNWTDCKTSKGYGRFRVGGRVGRIVRAHRFAYELENGPIERGKVCMHICDNPGCVRPSHLSIGDQKDNIADKVLKNRQQRGVQLPQAKLTDEGVREIRGATGTQSEIAKRFGVHQASVSRIKARKIWKHVLDTHQSEPQTSCFGLDVGNHVEGLYSHYLRLTKDAQAASQLVASHIAAQREPPDEKLLDVEQVSSILNVNQKLVRAMTKDGRLRSVRVGNLIRVKRQWLDTVMTPTSDW